ncbi:EF hand [Ekhidna lutea]|uniref:EF hand n=1 Tax=Ekhidna lutea TaxID=447679 RepID=A0A239GLF4_EKHLU|nr:EF-hand domain-containing protein [Ekhidna lutea]SNS70019.1 EF hand [Ekhidna lutea]
MSAEFQRKKLGYFFRILDLNSNSSLQMDDFTEMVEKVRVTMGYDPGDKGHQRITDKAVRLFNSLVDDIKPFSFNQVTEDEWVDFFLKKVILSKDEDILDEYKELIFNFMFDFFDQNRDGYISKKEYEDFYEIFGINKEYCDKAYHLLDKSQSGKLSRYDLMGAVEDFFAASDTTLPGNWIFGNWESEPHAVL